MMKKSKISITGILLIIVLLVGILLSLIRYQLMSSNMIVISELNVIVTSRLISILYYFCIFLLNNAIYFLLIIYIILNMIIKNEKTMMIIKIFTFLLMGVFLVYSLVSSTTTLITLFGTEYMIKLSIINLCGMTANIMIMLGIMIYIINSIPNGRVLYFINTVLMIGNILFSLLISVASIILSEIDFFLFVSIIYTLVIFIARLLIPIYFYNN